MNATPTVSTEKSWSTFRARAALAGHSAVKNERGWITVGRWGRTLTFHSLAQAEAWLSRVLGAASRG